MLRALALRAKAWFETPLELPASHVAGGSVGPAGTVFSAESPLTTLHPRFIIPPVAISFFGRAYYGRKRVR